MELLLVGIGTGNPQHLTLQAIRALNRADLVLVPRKGADKADLAELRRAIVAEVVTNPGTTIAEFDMPVRDPDNPSYLARVNDWHDSIAVRWSEAIAQHPGAATVALLVWGDPSLYDSTLRIAARLPGCDVTVVPGLMSPQVLAAAHGIPLNDLGAPFLVTTGRRLRDTGWPASRCCRQAVGRRPSHSSPAHSTHVMQSSCTHNSPSPRPHCERPGTTCGRRSCSAPARADRATPGWSPTSTTTWRS